MATKNLSSKCAPFAHKITGENIINYLSSFTQLLPNYLTQGWLKKLRKKEKLRIANHKQSYQTKPKLSRISPKKFIHCLFSEASSKGKHQQKKTFYLDRLKKFIHNILCP